MSVPILITKLAVPPLRAGIVPRMTLVQQLDRGLKMGHHLLLLSAPAGFGKTTLLSEWIFYPRPAAAEPGLKPDPARVGWVSLDGSDNDTARFWVYFLSALRKIYPGIGETILADMVSSQPPPVEFLLAELINQVAAQEERGILVLDDFHTIENKAIHDSLIYWVENQPPNLHLVISTRMDPSMPLARLRARQQLTELREGDLRFSRQETAQFMRQVMLADLSPADLTTLEQHVEGWIAGLQMLAMTMRSKEDISSVIANLAGSHRFILDYLTEEVFNSQKETVQQFLLETSILNQLTAGLCDAVTGRTDSQEVLEYLENANLFIVPLDDERCWYRYHQLFRDLLRTRQQKKNPARTAVLYRSAAQWHSANGYAQEALEYALITPDMPYAADILEVEARQKGVLPVHWLERLPLDMVRARPLLCAIFAASKAIKEGTSRDEVEKLHQEAERGLAQMCLECEVDPLYEVLVRGHIALTRAILALGEGAPLTTIEMASLALAQLPDELVSERCSAYLIQAQGYLFLGESDKALNSVDGALFLARRNRQYPRLFVSACLRQLILSSVGRLNEAASLCREMLEEVERAPENHPLQRLPELGAVHIGLGRILLEQHNLEGAEAHIQQGLSLISRTGQAGILRDGVMALCRLHCVRGESTTAAQIIGKYTSLEFLHQSFLSTLEARMNLAAAPTDPNALARLARWVAESQIDLADPQIDPVFSGYRAGYFLYLVTIEALIFLHTVHEEPPAKPDLAPVIQFLTRQLDQSQKLGRDGITLELLILLALAYHAMGDAPRALQPLETALLLAQREGYFTIFIEHGRPMYALLVEAAQRRMGGAYVQQLLGAFPLGWVSPALKPTAVPQAGLVEPLSEREIEVLQLIAAGLSNQEIADKLFLAVSTVKKHINNLYGKLNVNKRTEAVKRGRELGLL